MPTVLDFNPSFPSPLPTPKLDRKPAEVSNFRAPSLALSHLQSRFPHARFVGEPRSAEQIGPGVTLGDGTVIDFSRGQPLISTSAIGRDVQIGGNSVIHGSRVANGARVLDNAHVIRSELGLNSSVIDSARVENTSLDQGATVAVHAQLKDARVGENAYVGNNVRLEGATIVPNGRVVDEDGFKTPASPQGPELRGERSSMQETPWSSVVLYGANEI